MNTQKRKKEGKQAKVNVTRKKVQRSVPFKCRTLVDCLIFMQESKKILSFFNNFNNLEYFLHSEPLNVKITHTQGYIHLVTFIRNQISIQTLLKIPKARTSDNMFYEYSVGMYINTLLTKYPCFIRTYGLYKNRYKKDNDETNYIEDITRVNITPKIYELTCRERLTIMIEYIESIPFIKYIIKNHKRPSYASNITQILFQVYGPLTAIGDSFTHYDLHAGNVLLYTIPNKQYINMEYRYDTHTVAFKTTVIAKIIDYGRAHCPQSEHIAAEVCKESQCDARRNCGQEFGFYFLSKHKKKAKWIDSYKINKSHDLRLAHSIKETLPEDEPIHNLLHTIQYREEIGTPEILRDTPNKTYNIDGFLPKLTAITLSPAFLNQNKHYHKSKTCKGTMITYMTGSKQMIFVPAT
jgi:hypothetical protein